MRNLGFDGRMFWIQTSIYGARQLAGAYPNPHQRNNGIDLLARILQQAGITREEWESV
jgi:hypothetical protein